MMAKRSMFEEDIVQKLSRCAYMNTQTKFAGSVCTMVKCHIIFEA